MKTLHLVSVLFSMLAGHAGAQPALADRHPLLPSDVIVQLGTASDTRTIAAGAVWDWDARWKWWGNGKWSGYTEVIVGHWRVRSEGTRYDATVTQLGATPTFRYRPADSDWFVEAGIGINVLAPIYRSTTRRFSTAFNFGDHLGIGQRSNDRAWEWMLRYQHFSNASIRKPNPGQNFVQLRFSIPLN
jgi:hypothetical protein